MERVIDRDMNYAFGLGYRGPGYGDHTEVMNMCEYPAIIEAGTFRLN